MRTSAARPWRRRSRRISATTRASRPWRRPAVWRGRGRASAPSRRSTGSSPTIPSAGLAQNLQRGDLPLFVGIDTAREALLKVPALGQGRFLVAQAAAPREPSGAPRTGDRTRGARGRQPEAPHRLTLIQRTTTNKQTTRFPMRAVAMFPTEKKIRVIDRPAPDARGRRPGPAAHAGGRRVRDRSRDRALRVRHAARGRAVPGDGARVAGRGGRGRQRGLAASSPATSSVTTVRRPCGRPECRPCQHNRPDFCRDRRVHRARHQGAARLHDRRGRRPGEEHARRAARAGRHRRPDRAAHHRGEGAQRARLDPDAHALDRSREGGEARPQRRGAGRAGRSASWARWRCWCAASTPGSTRARARPARAPPGSRASGAQYIESATLPVGELGKQMGNVDLILRGDRRRPAWPSRPCPRSARTAC